MPKQQQARPTGQNRGSAPPAGGAPAAAPATPALRRASAEDAPSARFFADPRRSFQVALMASLLLHAIVLSIHFRLPQMVIAKADKSLEVILVNAKSAARPEKPQALAQANLDGGGNTDQDRRAKTPLPASPQKREGDALVEARKRVQQMEQVQQKLLTQAESTAPIRADTRASEQAEPAPQLSGFDLTQSALAIARLEAQIHKDIDEYNKRPRKKYIGARAVEYHFAQYVEDWRQKIERVGTLNYPEAAKGKLYGDLLAVVTIRADGTVQDVEIRRSSGQKVLDDAVRRIVRLASPFAPFPPEVRRDAELVEIARTWTFTNSSQLSTSAK